MTNKVLHYYKSQNEHFWYCGTKTKEGLIEITKEQWDAHIQKIKKDK